MEDLFFPLLDESKKDGRCSGLFGKGVSISDKRKILNPLKYVTGSLPLTAYEVRVVCVSSFPRACIGSTNSSFDMEIEIVCREV